MPLSMLTKAIPGAHDCNIVVSAPSPSPPNPYPVETGNPTTG
jgi:hypothetical protein